MDKFAEITSQSERGKEHNNLHIKQFWFSLHLNMNKKLMS